MAKALAKIDPINSQIRWASLIRRKKYKVPGPNSLWHCDDHHSLIRWEFVTHGDIDGFSRYIVYLHCPINNKKETSWSVWASNLRDGNTTQNKNRQRRRKCTNMRFNDIMKRARQRKLYCSFISAQSTDWAIVAWCVRLISCQFYYTFQAMEDQGLYNSNCMIIVQQ